ncbi:unnamed protein product [Bathycoccus prasinos]
MNHAISSSSVSSSSSFKAKTTMKKTAFSAASRRVFNNTVVFSTPKGQNQFSTTTRRATTSVKATMMSSKSKNSSFGFGRWCLTSQQPKSHHHLQNTFTKLSFFKASSSYSSSSHAVVAAASAAKEATSMTPEEIASQPRWELERHFKYDSPNDGKIDREMDAIETQCKEFKAKYEGKLKAGENNLLLEAIEMFEEIDIKLTRALSYVSLASDTRLEDAKMQQRKAQLILRCGSFQGNFLQWFSLEIANLEEDDVEKQYLLHDGKLKTKYKAFIEEERRSKPYNLSKEVERALTVRSAFAGKRQVVEFYGNELSRLRFPMKDDESGETKEVNMEVLLAKMTSSKDTKTRRECMNILNEGLVKFERTCALSLNMVAGSWHIENTERGFKNLRSQRNVSNNVPDEAVDSLLTAVKTTGVDLCKKYYRLKKGILKETQGLEEFTWADRNATIDIGTGSDSYSWEQAVQICKDGIDVPAADGKRGGAYCSSSYGCGPFQLLNFTGTQRDVATLAHESGHGVHFILSYQQGILQYHPPLTLAETASIFGEMIVFRDLLERAPSDQDRLQMIMGKCDDIINSVVRQCSFDAFEAKVHEKRQNGQVTPEEMTEAWKECMVDYYGEEGDVYDSYKDTSHLWAYVSALPQRGLCATLTRLPIGSSGPYNGYTPATGRFRREVVGVALGGRNQRIRRSVGAVGIRSGVGYILE